jgi:hypothetical protein
MARRPRIFAAPATTWPAAIEPIQQTESTQPTQPTQPTSMRGEAIPSPADRNILSRFSWGITPALVRESADAGGARSWFERQLEPDSIADPIADGLVDWWPHLAWSPAEKVAADQAGELGAFGQDRDFARWTLLRRMTSNRQLLEVMTDVWGNLLYISLGAKSFPHRPRYDATIRAHALGTYEQLLTAAVLHPCMLCFLDNDKSTKTAPNENLGRELLELHTVGRRAGYTERDVRHSMRILTGHRVYKDGTCEGFYAPEDHYVGRVHVLDFAKPNRRPDGQGVSRKYLSYLAHHESTANRIAKLLAVRFVSDNPSKELVDALAATYLESGTDIPATLRALVDSDEFAGSIGQKVRTPVEDFVNTYRTMQVTVLPPGDGDDDAATTILTSCASMGQQIFEWPRPDGFPDSGEAWSSACRMLGSWQVHKNIAGGQLPREGIVYQPVEYWVGSLPVRFRDLVDRVCRLILAKGHTGRLLRTAEKAVDAQADELITADHRVVRSRIPLLLHALLDSPDHMRR